MRLINGWNKDRPGPPGYLFHLLYSHKYSCMSLICNIRYLIVLEGLQILSIVYRHLRTMYVCILKGSIAFNQVGRDKIRVAICVALEAKIQHLCFFIFLG